MVENGRKREALRELTRGMNLALRKESLGT